MHRMSVVTSVVRSGSVLEDVGSYRLAGSYSLCALGSNYREP